MGLKTSNSIFYLFVLSDCFQNKKTKKKINRIYTRSSLLATCFEREKEIQWIYFFFFTEAVRCGNLMKFQQD